MSSSVGYTINQIPPAPDTLQLHAGTGPGEPVNIPVQAARPKENPHHYCFLRRHEQSLYIKISDLVRRVKIPAFELNEQIVARYGNVSELLNRHEKLVGRCIKIASERSRCGGYEEARTRKRLIDFILRHMNGRLRLEEASLELDRFRIDENYFFQIIEAGSFAEGIQDFLGNYYLKEELIATGAYTKVYPLRILISTGGNDEKEKVALTTKTTKIKKRKIAVRQFVTGRYILDRLHLMKIPHIPERCNFSLYKKNSEQIIAITDRREADACDCLSQMLVDKIPFSAILPLFINLLCCVCETLSTMHAGGYIHGDVKLENVLVDVNLIDPELSDFGLAGMKGSVVRGGTYLPPEAETGKSLLDESLDMYGVGYMIAVFIDYVVKQKHQEALNFHETVGNLLTLKVDLLNEDPEKRPSAEQALERLKKI